jgi:hypothetical protein
MQPIACFIVDEGIATPVPLTGRERHHLCKDPPHNARKKLSNTSTCKPPHVSQFLHPCGTPYVISTIQWKGVKVEIEFDFHGLELFVCVREFLEYPHKSRHCVLVITHFHIVDEVWIEKGTGIMEVTINQGFSLFGSTRWPGILKGAFCKATKWQRKALMIMYTLPIHGCLPLNFYAATTAFIIVQ